MQPERSFKKTIMLGVAFALTLAAGFAGGISLNAEAASKVVASIPLLSDGLNPTPDSSADMSDFWKAWNVLDARFVQTHATTTPPTEKERVYNAIAGLAASYGDPYTTFFPPQQAQDFKDQITGNFGGIGMEIGVDKTGQIVVIAPLKGTPSEKAGFKPGDAIISIDGKTTEGMSTDAAVDAIRGPKGTTVTLIISRDGTQMTIPVVRDTINTPTIDYSLDSKTGVYTIALYTFTATSGDLFDQALADFQKSGSDKLIIDLRGDPGGYLDSAVSIASHFLPSGSVVVTEDYKGKQENVVHRSTGSGGISESVKTAILIDQGSASASEILSGALQDDKKATLIGTRSFGKGSVQELVNIDGGSLKVTVARWLTPLGRSISLNGLTPDIEADLSKDDIANHVDSQKARAVQFLTTGQ